MHNLPFGIAQVASLLPLTMSRVTAANSIYVNCPFCGDQEGHMNINYDNDTWRCVRCDKGGGMLDLYTEMYGGSRGEACEEICASLGVQNPRPPRRHKKAPMNRPVIFHPENVKSVPQSERAAPEEIHRTLTALMHMLSLSDLHRRKLRARGLNDLQINELGYRSTPPPFACQLLTSRLISKGFKIQGVPGFYQNDRGSWTVKFGVRTAGIMVPARSIDGLIQGIQIRLDVPIVDPNRPEKGPTKYIWLSSSSLVMGVSVGCPPHLVGDPRAKVVYITEGYIKADVSHYLADRTFVTGGGANNVAQIERLIKALAATGTTEEIIEAMDMDKFTNKNVAAGALSTRQLALKYGLRCRQLVWDPKYKGVDDWLLSLHQRQAAA